MKESQKILFPKTPSELARFFLTLHAERQRGNLRMPTSAKVYSVYYYECPLVLEYTLYSISLVERGFYRNSSLNMSENAVF